MTDQNADWASLRLDDAAGVDRAAAELSRRDSILAEVIRSSGPMRPRLEPNRFRMILRAIFSQQISMSAAKSIRRRFERLMRGARITPARVAGLTEEEIRGAGVTRQKARYIRTAAEEINSRRVRLDRLGRMTDEEVSEHLTALPGVGPWTVEMFLMFSLGRPDVFPVGDLGVRNAIKSLYGVDTPDGCVEFAERWGPLRSVATWYLWRYADKPTDGESPQGAEPYPV